MVKYWLMLINTSNIKEELEKLMEYLSASLNLKFTYIYF
ncbi:MAG: hypothetical protein PG979_000202 [Rickettsia asembonensis]|nr:MAG: hypothetical protein PG979_000202 [Rickettsia asembonensis]